jgi:hypothetical protein
MPVTSPPNAAAARPSPALEENGRNDGRRRLGPGACQVVRGDGLCADGLGPDVPAAISATVAVLVVPAPVLGLAAASRSPKARRHRR